jgi:hypothetical protein
MFCVASYSVFYRLFQPFYCSFSSIREIVTCNKTMKSLLHLITFKLSEWSRTPFG